MNLMLSVMILVISGLGDVLRNTESAENLEETDQNVFDDEPNIGNKNPFPLKPVDTNRILEAFSLWRTLIKTVMEVRKDNFYIYSTGRYFFKGSFVVPSC